MDLELAQGGGAVASPPALAAYEAHRAVDGVLRAVNHYVLGDRPAAKNVICEVSLKRLVASSRVQRARMLALALGLHALARLPRIPAIGRLFRRHWYGDPSPRESR